MISKITTLSMNAHIHRFVTTSHHKRLSRLYVVFDNYIHELA